MPGKALPRRFEQPVDVALADAEPRRRRLHADAVASAIDYVLGEDLTDFVLLGHSYGGTIVSRMAEEMPGRIRRLIYWNAFVLEDGESIEAVSPPHYKGLMDSIAYSGAYGPGAVKLPFPVWREAFMNDADLALAEQTYEPKSGG